MPSEVSLALCICTRNRPDDLRRCLEAIAKSIRMPEQVIVSDDGDEGKTNQELASSFSFVSYQKGPRVGLGANRNACIAAVNTAYVIFIDDDVTVPSTFFETAYGVCEQNATCSWATIVSGIEYKHLETAVIRIEPGNSDFWGFQRVKPTGQVKALVINATIFPAGLFRLAKFDPLLRYGSEEIDMARHAVSLGYQIHFNSDLFVDHYPSSINREEYAGFIEASRLYATAKDYWAYQHSPIKAVLFALLAPPKLVIALGRRFGFSGVVRACRAIALSVRYAKTAMSGV